ncbi:conserved hypothetical protein [Stigmatella aurantiaca DW4/3-1]|uniref:Beta-propeller repeat protein n=1 Tax=Stigmatella aurantiaca (strain DW4/3-1) TaxID=378806 RepID=Q097V2_STIAD|nr:conserved hypothetical protein [Stigmatella aurantiaca DW4/3-1]
MPFPPRRGAAQAAEYTDTALICWDGILKEPFGPVQGKRPEQALLPKPWKDAHLPKIGGMRRVSSRVLWSSLLAVLCGCSTAVQPRVRGEPAEEGLRVDFLGAGSSQLSALSAQERELLAIGTFEGSLVLGGQHRVSSGDRDVLVARLTPEGALRWLRHWGGPGDDLGDALVARADGSIFVVGGFSAGALFEGTPLPNDGGYDCFVAKLAGDTGHPLWVRRFGGTGDAICRSVAVDGAGDVFVTGFFNGQVDLGQGRQSSAGGSDTFLVKLSGQEGVPQWARVFGGPGDDIGRNVAVGATGTVFLTGHFSSDVEPSVGAIDFGTGPVRSTGDSDAFLAAFAGDGRTLWARALGGPNYDMAKAVVPAADGSLYLTGLFQRDVPQQPGQSRFLSGGFEGFVGRYTASGEELWQRRFPTLLSGHSIALTSGGALAMVGHFTSSLEINAGKTLQAEGPSDVVALIFNDFGEIQRGWRLGGPGADYGYSVASAPWGIVVGGIREEASSSHGFLAHLPWP